MTDRIRHRARLLARRSALEEAHAAAMRDLCEALAAAYRMPPFRHLTSEQQDDLWSEATEMCEPIDGDPAAWRAAAAGPFADLVERQYALARRIMTAESAFVATFFD